MKKRHSPEQIVRKLRLADERIASGASIPEVARELGVSEATYHRWRNRYGGMNLPSKGRASLHPLGQRPGVHRQSRQAVARSLRG